MRSLYKVARPNRLHLLFGILLCSLVVLFSISAKLAAYRHAPERTQIAAMKLPLKSLASLSEATTQSPILLPQSLLLALLFFVVVAVGFVVRGAETLPTGDRWFLPKLAVRPPPSL